MNNYTFDEIKLGMTESFKVTVTEEMMNYFLKITGDNNPLHMPSSDPNKRRIVYGMLTASFISTLGGVYLPGKNCLIHKVETAFVTPVHIGDELTVSGTVDKIMEAFKTIMIKVEIRNQDGVKVLRGKLEAGVLDE